MENKLKTIKDAFRVNMQNAKRTWKSQSKNTQATNIMFLVLLLLAFILVMLVVAPKVVAALSALAFIFGILFCVWMFIRMCLE